MRLQFAPVLVLLLAGCAPAAASPTAVHLTETRIAALPSATVSETAVTFTPDTTATPEAKLTTAPTPTWQTCIFTAGSAGAEVYAAPLPTYSNPPDPRGIMAAGESAPVAFRGSIFEGVLWVGIVWDSGAASQPDVGYVMADESTLQGECPMLLDDNTFAGTGPTVIEPDEIDYHIHMAGDVGTVWLFTQTLPAEDGDLSHMIEVTAELQAGSVRWADYAITCESEGASAARWGFWDREQGATSLQTCAETLRETINFSTEHYIEVTLPAGGVPITYTIRIELTQFDA